MSMFCYQCQEAAHGTGCEIKGVCGKTPTTAILQDALVHAARGVAIYATAVRPLGELPTQTAEWLRLALFTTITNANFDDQAIFERVLEGLALRATLRDLCERKEIVVGLSHVDAATFSATSVDELVAMAQQLGVKRTGNEDVRSLRELLTYGLKGLAAYLHHAAELGAFDAEVESFLERALAATVDDSLDGASLTALVLEAGRNGVSAMALLDGANTGRFGNPEITKVKIGVGSRPGILVSGHDLSDLEQLLEQSKDAGIDIYTHSEMLPAHSYPGLKKHGHLFGNYGNAWWRQNREFESFRGPILFTTNCIVPPPKSASYADKVWTTGAAGFPGFRHIPKQGTGSKDFSEIIAFAKNCPPPLELEKGEILGGFAHDQILKLAGPVVEAVKSGAVRKFVVMAGCDARQKERSYYTDYAANLPSDAIILTAGCAKYRYNKLDLGDIGGIPRVLDAGQCNDSYSLAVTALKLKEVFGLDDINELPIEYNIAWYEQKAVIVLLALLHLGVKNIRLGPTLPAFLSPGVAGVLVDTFGLKGINTVQEDMASSFGAPESAVDESVVA
ncbi:MAG TPA: hydroxylamine reductase [Fibrobacteria bacterium]|nr:hydroxylamine reductase [Fibrobacteria bacterium]